MEIMQPELEEEEEELLIITDKLVIIHIVLKLEETVLEEKLGLHITHQEQTCFQTDLALHL
jgi:hypothetical protein